MADWQGYLDIHQDRFLQELTDFLRIPSISSLPEHAGDVSRAAQWVADRLSAAGMENVAVMPTGGHPIVYADWRHAEGQPTILIYGHFDVQPVDPIALWTSPPFEPDLRDGRVYARGASDDKGNMLIPILALEARLASDDRLPVNVKCFFEGQEEIGSPQLPEFIAARKEMLACDLVLSADGGQWAADQPSLVIGRRGLCALQIDVTAADHDVHSGTYGGTFMNPIHALSAVIASFRSADGTILVDGFYDAVRMPDAPETALLEAVPWEEAEYRQGLGVPKLHGEPGFSTYERAWVRPTLEVNGIYGGFQGEGIKTVIPSSAHAKVTCRLVPDQDPDGIFHKVAGHVRQHAPDAVRTAVHRLAGSALPFWMPFDHPGNRAAADVLTALYGKAPHVVRMGGTIPVGSLFLKHLNAYMVNFAFGLKDERIHAPDEFFRLASFTRGQRAYGAMLEALRHPPDS